jgi:hypothetical protein
MPVDWFYVCTGLLDPSPRTAKGVWSQTVPLARGCWILTFVRKTSLLTWIPACAGMTGLSACHFVLAATIASATLRGASV